MAMTVLIRSMMPMRQFRPWMWRFFVIALLAAICRLSHGEQLAAARELPLQKGSANVDVGEAARALPRTEGNTHVLRCWQHGQLILERRVHSMPTAAARIVEPGIVDRPRARLFDLRNSTCLFE